MAGAGVFLASASIVAGDVRVSQDGGALVNLATLPTVTPAASKLVKVTLSASEMTADNVAVVFSQATGGTWKDLVLNLATVANQMDDLSTPTNITAGTITTVTNLTNAPTVGDLTATMKTSVTTAATASTPALSAAGVQAIWDALTTALTTVGSIGKRVADNLDAAVSSRLAAASYTAPNSVVAIRTEMDTNSTKLANLDATVSSRSTYAGGAVASVTGNVTGSVGSVTAAVTVGAINTDAVSAASVAAAAVTKIQSGLATPTNVPSAASIVAAMLAATLEGSLTLVQAWRIMLSVMAGKSSGGGTTAIAFRDMADSKDRVNATVDASGNRSSVTRDGS